MRILGWLLMIALLVGTLVGAGFVLNGSPGEQGKRDAREAAAAQSPDYVLCLGNIEAEGGPVDLIAEQPGIVVEIAPSRVDGKDRVFKKGEAIVKLDSREAEIRLGKAQAAVAAAQLALDLAKKFPQKHELDIKAQDAVIAATGQEKVREELKVVMGKRAFTQGISENTKDFDRMLDALKNGFDEKIKIEQVNLDKLKLIDPKDEIRKAETDLKAKQKDEALAKHALEQFSVVAPSDGTVLRVHTKVGEAVGPQTQMPVVQFCPNTPRLVKAEVLQEWSHLVKPGQEAVVRDDTSRKTEWKGRVRSVSDWILPKRTRISEPFMTNDVRTMECIVEFVGEPPVLIGQRVRVELKVK